MFKVGDYKISFKKEWSFHPRIITPDGAAVGRIFIWCNIHNTIFGSGNSAAAILNPVDRYDKILGKKIALEKALKQGHFNKQFRTEIWSAFWEWVQSWQIQSNTDKVPQNRV